MTKSMIDQKLEQHADSSAVAAVELSRRQLKRRRDRAKADAERAAVKARDEAAGVVSRARGVVGASHPDWYAPAVLEWVQSPPDTPCPPEIEAEYQRYLTALDADTPGGRAEFLTQVRETFNNQEDR